MQEKILSKTEEILEALRFLSARCDGAAERDGVGFSKPDSYKGKRLAVQEWLTEEEAELALAMLDKYRDGQLKEAGLSLPDKEQALQEARRAEDSLGQIAIKDDLLIVTFPYSPRLVAKIKAVRKARWNGATWTVPIASGQELRTVLPGFAITADARQAIEAYVPPAVVYAGKLTLDKETIIAAFEYDPDLVATVKTIKGARFNGTDKTWRIPVGQAQITLETLTAFEVDLAIHAWLKADTAAEKAQARKEAKVSKKLRQADLDQPLPSGRQLFKHQQEGVRWLLDKKRAILADEMGLGKLQAVDTKILTPNGWREIGQLRIGDCIIGSDGKPTRVTGVFPQGVKDNYRVWFSDGSSVEAGDEHLWTVAIRQGGRKWVDLTLSTKQMRERAIVHRTWPGRADTALDLGKTALYLPMLSAPVEFDRADDLPLPPYLLGQLIANGYLGGTTPTIASNALDAGEIQRRLIEERVDFRRVEYGSVTRFCIRGINATIRELGLDHLSRDKFIPERYLRARPNERIALLHGLMDGDGSCSKTHNKLTYSSISKTLAYNVQELVEGLGGIASVQTRDRTGEGKPVEYRVRVRLPASIKPFSVSRKLSRYNPGRLALPCRTFIRAEFSRSVESVCISVEAEDELYVTEHCIVTHNTITSLVAAKAFDLPIIVVAPASLLINWQREAEMAGVEIAVYSWAKIPKAPESDFVLIADEFHYCQSIKSIRTKAMLSLAKSEHCRALYGLSGSPIKNGRPTNLYPLLVAIKHPIAQDRREYERRYCNAHETRWTRWDVSGASNLDELHAKTKDAILRRLKKDCLDLPEKTRVIRAVEVSEKARKVYENTFARLRAEYRKKFLGDSADDESLSGPAEALVMINYARHATSLAKVDTAVELAQDVIEEGGQVVLFVAFLESGRQIAEALGCRMLSGGETGPDRQQMVDDFQAGKQKALVCTFGAGGVGITLTAAQTVILVDRPWTPGEVVQGEDRLHRIGQRNAVTAIWLQYKGVDIGIDKLLQAKEDRIELVLAGKRKTLRGISNPAEFAAQLLPLIMEE